MVAVSHVTSVVTSLAMTVCLMECLFFSAYGCSKPRDHVITSVAMNESESVNQEADFIINPFLLPSEPLEQ